MREFRSAERPVIFSLFALHAIIFFLIAVSLRTWATGDTSHYIDLAQNLRDGHFGIFTANGFEPEGMRSAAYPIFILICDFLPGEAELDVVIVQGVLYLVSILLVWKLVRKAFGSGVSNTFLLLFGGVSIHCVRKLFRFAGSPVHFFARRLGIRG